MLMLKKKQTKKKGVMLSSSRHAGLMALGVPPMKASPWREHMLARVGRRVQPADSGHWEIREHFVMHP